MDASAPLPSSLAALTEVWVRLHGVPPILQTDDRLMAATVMIGKPIHVDALSLFKEPKAVLMKFLSPVQEKLKMLVTLFINGAGFKVDVVPESRRSSSAPPPPHHTIKNIRWMTIMNRRSRQARTRTGKVRRARTLIPRPKLLLRKSRESERVRATLNRFRWLR